MVIFLTVFAAIFIAEMGDKTQLLLVAMAGKYKISHILTGTWLATVLLNLLAVAVGAALGSYLDMRLIKLAAGLAFFWFAYSTLEESDEEESEKEFRRGFGPVEPSLYPSFWENWEIKPSFQGSRWRLLMREEVLVTRVMYLQAVRWA